MNKDAIKKHVQAIEKLLSEEEELSEFVLGRHIPGFRPLRDGEEWCRTTFWNDGNLPEGFRPLIIGEPIELGDQFHNGPVTEGSEYWTTHRSTDMSVIGEKAADSAHAPHRTRRPLPEPAKVPLGQYDVPAGSIFAEVERSGDTVPANIWYTPICILPEEVHFRNQYDRRFVINFKYMAESGRWMIHRPGNLDANGKPVFEPCWKLQ